MSDNVVVKQDAAAPTGFFEAEAAGLRWLSAANGVRCAEVEGVSPGRIELRRIIETSPSRAAARRFGTELAVTHDAGAASFGAPPDGWDGPLFIGSRRMPSETSEHWGDFYASARVLPFLDVAERAGNLTGAERETVEAACEVISRGAFDDGETPARIHGDLWNGNVLWAEHGVVLIDPAAHGGHRETDLAMLALFGCPNLADVREGYEATHPLMPGWEERIPVHQLHPLAVHAAGHGRGYGVELARAARAVLQLG
ncbi:fructosamine kinase family protein [Paramicrobacterium agarici]|uniref:Fructosamine-3-kinase n=1 Tax=Paramicrobacterium agarici TaxID=630514 RepID=A0A2A9DXB5_9MICO|nr:fructosamine kinase family protein [Microbacterium agarici]PFG31016.1 fructosamine-3-kinase [Microbacterium agarici]